MVFLRLIIFILISGAVAFGTVFSARGETDADPFALAQQAASEGRYRVVVDVLSELLGSDDVEPRDRIVALANRGIAYSLLGAYELARRDLDAAVAIDPNHDLSLNHLGLLAERVDGDHGLAASYFSKAAAGGFAPAMVNLANLLRSGIGVPKDEKQAASLYRGAAAEGYALAYVPLGRMLMSGEGIPRDRGEGLAWISRGAESGIIDAHFELGLAFTGGNGVGQDLAEAAAHFRVAAMQGHAEAQNQLGYFYRQGRGVEQDFLEAAKWYRLSADQGNLKAMNRLAWLLATCPSQQVCNGRGALELARQAANVESSPSVLDSLAAAQARVGNFSDAVETMERAIALMPAGAAGYGAYRRRLELYKRGTPYQL